MNLYALIIGILLAILIIYRFRKTRLEKTRWAYVLLIASFPLYYWAFALYVGDYSALLKEVGFGIVFIGLSYLAYTLKRRIALLLLAALSLFHAVYDGFHNYWFINSGTPAWWLEFCGSIDLIIGIYLLYLSTTLKRSSPNRMLS